MENNKKIIRKLKIARGQIDGIIKMIEEDRYCIDITTQIFATNALLKNSTIDILSTHIERCIKEAVLSKNKEELDNKLKHFKELIKKL